MAIPQYNTLSVKQIKTFIATHAQILNYLPEEQEWDKLPKEWLCNIINTTVEAEFVSWVKERIEYRNAHVVKEKKLAINMDPAIMKAFLGSTAVSSKFKQPTCHPISFVTIPFHFYSIKGQRHEYA